MGALYFTISFLDKQDTPADSDIAPKWGTPFGVHITRLPPGNDKIVVCGDMGLIIYA